MKVEGNNLYFAKTKENAVIPTKNEEDAGYDIYACFDEDFIVIESLQTKLVPTGIATAMSDNYYAQIQERGSTGSKGIKYGAGVIDSSYRGEWFVPITNCNYETLIISKLSQKDFLEKYAESEDETGINKYYTFKNESGIYKFYTFNDEIIEYNKQTKECTNAIFYPYSKAIAQFVILPVPKLNTVELSYDELQTIKSKRGKGALGSSNK